MFRLAWAIHQDRKGQEWTGTGYVPPWITELQLAQKYPQYPGVNFHKWIWRRRASILMQAEAKSYSFEEKKG